ncbi:CAP domain-containing protein [Frigidibacter sp. SD6-1]|uniref:CAP domain-containing protein n=1 Tax=Frigidibacter sp. SD6-1 TaxID=3032581 RepID=UPI0024E02AC8|nr:CAP domain-containing protein [Frigidibacter sp. SD6-1]
MNKPFSAVLAAVLMLAACQTGQVQLAPDGRAVPQAYVIGPGDVGRVTYSMVDSINALRSAKGIAPLTLDAQLTAAAATHSRDMHLQNRPWHFGSDGSSPLLRVQRTGYPGKMLGENISETYENERETLAAWMQVADTRGVILDPNAVKVGFSWFQEPSGKLWWTLVTGS